MVVAAIAGCSQHQLTVDDDTNVVCIHYMCECEVDLSADVSVSNVCYCYR